MAKPRKEVKSEPVAAAEDNGASTDAIDAIEDGKIFAISRAARCRERQGACSPTHRSRSIP